MGIFNDIENISSSSGFSKVRGPPGVGFILTQDGDYDMQQKRLTNAKEGSNNNDLVTKHQLGVGLNDKLNENSDIDIQKS